MNASLAVALAFLAVPAPAGMRGEPRSEGAVKKARMSGKPAPAGISWVHRYDEAIKKAKAARKPIMIDFWADWCGWCKRLDQTTYVDPAVVKLSHDFVALKLDTDARGKNQEIALRYNVSTLPTIAFITPAGRQVLRLNGFQGPGQFPRTMQEAREAAARIMDWESELEKNPKDPTALFGLGVHLFEQEFYEDSRSLLYRAAAVDGHRPVGDRKQARMLIGIIQNYDRKFEEGEKVLKEALGFRPATEYDPKMMFILARLYVAWGKKDQGRGVLWSLVRDYPDSSITPKARELLTTLERAKKK
jgi:thiol-disulfide isomerase/thioredoxin